MTYVDTSVWCAYCYNEPESPGAVRWLAEAELDRTATALWTHASSICIDSRAASTARPVSGPIWPTRASGSVASGSLA